MGGVFRVVSRLGVVFGVLALCGVGLLHVRMGELEDLVRAGRRAPRERVIHTGVAPDGPLPADAPRRGERKTSAQKPETPVTLDERIRRLEARVEKSVLLEAPTQYFPQDVDGFARTFKLSSTQVARVRDIVERTRRRVDDLMATPDTGGKSPKEHIAEQNKRVAEAVANSASGGSYTVSLGFSEWHANKLAGREVTYGEELERIRKEGREELERELTEEQRKMFQNTDTSVLLGGAEAVGAISSFTEIELVR